MTEDIKKKILEIVAQEGGTPIGLYLFENIPPKKLNNAIKAYASSLGGDETVIMLYDGTILGSAKEGFVLTSKRLYSNAIGKVVIIDITDIISIIKLTNSKEIGVKTSNGIFEINTHVSFMDFYSKLLNTTIKLLNPASVSAADVSQTGRKYEPRCKFCGAGNENNNATCEYCGGAFALEESKAPDGTVLSYYKEYPLAPDFGAVTGVRLLLMDTDEGEGDYISYEYNRAYVTKEMIDKYRNVLENEGYFCDFEPEKDMPAYRYIKREEDMYIGFSAINGEGNHWVQVGKASAFDF